jgi:hypothetical protein
MSYFHFRVQNKYKYDTLLNIIEENKELIEQIKNQYIILLSQLTETPMISNELFINKIKEISNIGNIIVCYYIEENKKLKIVGSGTIIYEPKLTHHCKYVGHIEDIIVHNMHRSNGIATQIIQQLIDMANIKKCYKVILDCKPELYGFYEKIGLKRTGNQMSKYFIPPNI